MTLLTFFNCIEIHYLQSLSNVSPDPYVPSPSCPSKYTDFFIAVTCFPHKKQLTGWQFLSVNMNNYVSLHMGCLRSETGGGVRWRGGNWESSFDYPCFIRAKMGSKNGIACFLLNLSDLFTKKRGLYALFLVQFIPVLPAKLLRDL